MRLVFIFFILLLPSLALANSTLNICVPIDNAPFAFVDDDEKLQGFDIDMLNGMQLKSKLNLIQRDFASSMAGLGNAECDMVLSNVTVNERREQRILFSNPHIKSGVYAAVFDESPINDVETLQYSVVGVLKGSIAEEYAFNQFKGGVIYALRDNVNIIELLDNGTIEAILDSLPRLQQLKKTHKIRILDQSLFEEHIAYAIAKKHPLLLAEVNSALEKMQNDGTITEIYEKWFGKIKLEND